MRSRPVFLCDLTQAILASCLWHLCVLMYVHNSFVRIRVAPMYWITGSPDLGGLLFSKNVT